MLQSHFHEQGFGLRRDRLWDLGGQTTDEERANWDVPPPAQQLSQAEEAHRHKASMSENEMIEFRIRSERTGVAEKCNEKIVGEEDNSEQL
jgi:hypothetical protein